MDAAPYGFVDDVLILTELQCLSQLQSLDSPIWESMAQLHSSKREYFSVYFRGTKRAIEHVFASSSNDFVTHEYVRNNLRFVHVNCVLDDILHGDEKEQWANAAVLSEEETKETLETVLCARSQLRMLAEREHFGLQRTLLPLLRDSLRFTTLKLAYCGEIAEEFLRYQIDHSYILTEVVLEDNEWPNSVLALIKKFCLYQRRWNRVEASFSRTKIKDFDVVEFIEDFIDFWKQNGHLNCKFSYEVDGETRRSLTREETNDYLCYARALKYPFERSIANVCGGKVRGSVMFYRCVCNTNRPQSRECREKCYYPRFGINVGGGMSR